MNPFHYFEFRCNYLFFFINVTHLVYTTVQKFGISKIFNVCFCNKYYRFGVRGGGVVMRSERDVLRLGSCLNSAGYKF